MKRSFLGATQGNPPLTCWLSTSCRSMRELRRPAADRTSQRGSPSASRATTIPYEGPCLQDRFTASEIVRTQQTDALDPGHQRLYTYGKRGCSLPGVNSPNMSQTQLDLLEHLQRLGRRDSRGGHSPQGGAHDLEQGELHGGFRVVNGVMRAVLDLALQEFLRQLPQRRPVRRALPRTRVTR